MTSGANSDDEDLFGALADEFVSRHQRGESPGLSEYCGRYPKLADEIRSVFPTLIALEGSKSVSPASPAALEKVGKYQLLREIGRGGMGSVYEARHETLGRRVAIKVLPQRLASDQALARFQREARAIAKLHHSNIVPLFDVGVENEHQFFAMQLISGRSLDVALTDAKSSVSDGNTQSGHSADSAVDDMSIEQRLAALQALVETSDSGTDSSTQSESTFKWVAHVGSQIGDALSYSHSHNVLHRDVKPSNIIIDNGGVAWLSDFGLAKLDDDGITQTGDFVGTVRYMSPERFSNQCDERADIYGLGLTLYELLALRPAYALKDRAATIGQVCNSPLPPIRTLNPLIPKDLETVITKACEKDPEARYRTAAEFADDLRRFVSDEPVKARRVGLIGQFSRWAKRNKVLATALASIAALLMVIAVGSVAMTVHQSKLRKKAETNEANARLASARASDAQQAAETSQALAEQAERDRRRRQYFAEINLAAQRIGRAGGIRQVDDITERWQQDADKGTLGWEWYYLRTLCIASATVMPEQEGDVVVAASWSPDDNRIVLAYEDKEVAPNRNPHTLEIRDADTGAVLVVLKGHSAPVTAVDWHPVSNIIASASKDQSIRFWDAESGSCLRQLGPIDADLVAWSLDGSQLAFSSIKNSTSWLSILETANLDAASLDRLDVNDVVMLPPIRDFLANRELSWSPDATQIAAGMLTGEYGQVLKSAVWDLPTKEVVKAPFRSACVRWKPEGHELSQYVTCKPSGELQLWDAELDRQVGTFFGHTAQLNSFKFSPDGRRLLSAGFDKTVRIWDTESHQTTRIFQEHPMALRSVCWNRKGDRVLSASWEKDTRSWRINEERIRTITNSRDVPNRNLPQHGNTREVLDISWHPDGDWLATSAGGVRRVWDVNTGELVAQRVNFKNWFDDCNWNAAGTQLAYFGSGINICEVESDVIHVPKTHRGWTVSGDWHPDGNQILAAVKKTLRVIKLDDDATPDVISTSPSRYLSVKWNPTNTNVVAASESNTISVFDRNRKSEIAKLEGHAGSVWSIDWSPDGQLVASGSHDGTARIWNATTGELLQTLSGHNNQVRRVRWSPDGQRLATAGQDATVKLWDPQTGDEIMSLNDLHSSIRCVEWSPDGRKLAAGSLNGDVIIWDATPAYEVGDAGSFE